MRLTLIRNATLILEYRGRRLLIDPYFAPKHTLPSYTGKSKNPLVDLPCTAEEITQNIDMVIVSHLHSDHFDTVAQDALPKSLPVYCQPENDDTIREMGFANVQPIYNNIEWQGIRMTRIDGHHGTGAVETIMGKVSGFVLQAADEPVVYWAGDTILCEEVRTAIQAHTPDVIITHSSGATWPDPDRDGQRELIVMDAAQTIATAELAPRSRVVAIHMEALDHGTVTRAGLRRAATNANIAEERLLIPDDGQVLD